MAAGTDPLPGRLGVLLWSPEVTFKTAVTPALPAGIARVTARIDTGKGKVFGLGSPQALFFTPGESRAELQISIAELQTKALLLKAARSAGVLGGLTFGFGWKDDAGTRFAWQFAGCKIGTARLRGEAGGPFSLDLGVSCIGSVTEINTLDPSNLTEKPFRWYEGVHLKGGVADELRSLDVSINHNLTEHSPIPGTAPATNKRGAKYLTEGNEDIDFTHVRYAKSGANMHADTFTPFALSLVVTDIAGGGTPNTLTLGLTDAEYFSEEISVAPGDLFQFTATGAAKSFAAS